MKTPGKASEKPVKISEKPGEYPIRPAGYTWPRPENASSPLKWVVFLPPPLLGSRICPILCLIART